MLFIRTIKALQRLVLISINNSSANQSILQHKQQHLLSQHSSNFSAFSATLLNSKKSSADISSTVKLSDNCIKRLKELFAAENSDKGRFLRVAVDSGGCSGFEYKFSIDNKLNEDDKVIEKDNCRVVVDEQSLSYVSGSTIDYFEELIRTGFRVIANPNAEQGCSCGASFSVKI